MYGYLPQTPGLPSGGISGAGADTRGVAGAIVVRLASDGTVLTWRDGRTQAAAAEEASCEGVAQAPSIEDGASVTLHISDDDGFR